LLRGFFIGVEPMAWLTDVLERVVSGRTKANRGQYSFRPSS
jgi:hypothetical protein